MILVSTTCCEGQSRPLTLRSNSPLGTKRRRPDPPHFSGEKENDVVPGLLCPPSRPNLANVTNHGAFRLIEQTDKGEARLFSKLERCSVCGRDSQDDLAGLGFSSQIFIHEVYGPQSQALSP